MEMKSDAHQMQPNFFEGLNSQWTFFYLDDEISHVPLQMKAHE